MKLLRKNKHYLLIFFSLFFVFCSKQNKNKHCFESISKQVFSDTIKTFYPNGKLKTLIVKQNNKNNGCYVQFYLSGDTLNSSLYENDSLIYSITYDTLGHKIEDFRKIFINFNNEVYYVGDSVIISYYIKGPYRDTIFGVHGCSRISPDTKGIVGKTIKNKKTHIYKFNFVPDTKGIYCINIGFVDMELIKVITQKRIHINVLERVK